MVQIRIKRSWSKLLNHQLFSTQNSYFINLYDMLGVIWSWIQRTGIPRFPKKTGPLKVFGSSGSTKKRQGTKECHQAGNSQRKKSWKFPSKIINGAISTNQPNPNYNIWERDLQLTIIFCVLVCVLFYPSPSDPSTLVKLQWLSRHVLSQQATWSRPDGW